ncbi:MAG: hypothetical protein QOJ15_1507 [Bradyrhizobium sp.]|jgi:hypothetical protein|nr:hypothetical protein [Bradyrhizobium sp.]
MIEIPRDARPALGAARNPVAGSNRVFAEPMTLAEMGIEKTEAHRAQKIASIPKAKLRAHLDEVKASGGEITTAGSASRTMVSS